MPVFWVLIGVGCAFEVIGDVLFKKGAFAWGVVAYLSGTLLWAYSLRYEALSKAVMVFAVANALAGVLAGLAFFSETLTTIQWVGILLGCASLTLL